jgi:hypothetical protein
MCSWIGSDYANNKINNCWSNSTHIGEFTCFRFVIAYWLDNRASIRKDVAQISIFLKSLNILSFLPTFSYEHCEGNQNQTYAWFLAIPATC